MKKLLVGIALFSMGQITFAQEAGNINYANRVEFSDNNIDIGMPDGNNIVISAKGLANVQADAYVAVFSITQVGKTTEEVDELINQRLAPLLELAQQKAGVKVFTDMISFVPVYEFEETKKVFSKRTYNEIPVGFELKKNIHIQYTNPDLLKDFMAVSAQQEIYDLVKVDYFSSQIDTIKKQLMDRARGVLQEKKKHYEAILGKNFDDFDKKMADAYKVMLPIEMYRSYTAYQSLSPAFKRSSNIYETTKPTTLYYQPIVNKEFDFVINATILQPVIQVMYEIKIFINATEEQAATTQQKPDKEYILITPNGELKTLYLNN